MALPQCGVRPNLVLVNARTVIAGDTTKRSKVTTRISTRIPPGRNLLSPKGLRIVAEGHPETTPVDCE